MARKVLVTLHDDLNEELPADQTVAFSLDGTNYEIDLSEANAKEMREMLGRYIEAARTVSGKARKRTRQIMSTAPTQRATRGRADAVVIRQWAQTNNKPVSPRGRIPAWLVKEYEAATR